MSSSWQRCVGCFECHVCSTELGRRAGTAALMALIGLLGSPIDEVKSGDRVTRRCRGNQAPRHVFGHELG